LPTTVHLHPLPAHGTTTAESLQQDNASLANATGDIAAIIVGGIPIKGRELSRCASAADS
jgi:hypothetical protein